MKIIKKLLFGGAALLAAITSTSARENGPSSNPLTNGNNPAAALRACARPTAQRDLSINNVRVRLLNGGDMWWDLNKGSYFVPKPAAGQEGVSAMFAGSVWIGGYDGANLKVAAQTYRQNGNDFWPGPLNPSNATVNPGVTTTPTCASWDKHFEVSGANIKAFIDAYYADVNNDGVPDGSVPGAVVPVSDDMKKWPARGNADFNGYYNFNLPNQDLAPFFDNNNDQVYNPADGDFPIIEVRGCDATTWQKAQYADQMIWWVYNDEGAGGIHTETRGATIRMEVQALAFAYQTDNQINDMTFYRFKLLNRSAITLDSTHISLWSDPDLGCYLDDYIGCKNDFTKKVGNDSIFRSLGYVYNYDANDAVVCGGGGGRGYGDKVPILGVDYFRGALDENGKDLGMSSFLYYINNTAPAPPPGQSNPGNAQEFFNYMSGSWRDGERFTQGGEGYNPGSTDYTNFVFPNDPNNAGGWSMAALNLTPRDYRFIQTSGPFKLIPGATNEVIAGVVWVPDQNYPKPGLADLLAADDVAQNLFDNCFDIIDGPDAPLMNVVELNKELVITLTAAGNNIKNGIGESYAERDPAIPNPPAGMPHDTMYRFEGYRIYQVANSTVSVNDLTDATKAKEVFQVDVKNGITKAINWTQSSVVAGQYIPEIKVIGQNKGIQHSLHITKDQFGQQNSLTLGELVNHRKYYFIAVSYAYNKYAPFVEATRTGQIREYLQGRKTSSIIGIPRRPAAEILGATLGAVYGDAPTITRLDGKGSNGAFLDLDDATAKAIQGQDSLNVLTYKPGFAPIDVKVYDPYQVKGGNYVVSVGRNWNGTSNMPTPAGSLVIRDSARWELKDKDNPTRRWVSSKPISANNNQLIPDLGIAVTIGQQGGPGDPSVLNTDNGYVGSSITYTDNSKQWFAAIKDGQAFLPSEFTNYLRTAPGTLEEDIAFDPNEVYSKVLNGWFAPFKLCNCRPPVGTNPYISPGWTTASPATLCDGYIQKTATPKVRLGNLNNVDIIMTPDKNLWSRCVVVETSGKVQFDSGFPTQNDLSVPTPGVKQFDPRGHLSVDKNGLTVNDAGFNAAEIDPNDPAGFGWFPGYAVDVETGKRLNIFFGESSVYDGNNITPGVRGDIRTGADMLFNPSTSFVVGDNGQLDWINIGLGGFHNIYVTNERYNGCKSYRTNFSSAVRKQNFLRRAITWTSIVVPQTPMLSAKDGLIPTETRIKLRVAKPYEALEATNSNATYPQYGFSLDKFAPSVATTETSKNALSEINVVPNPYYGYSSDELRELDNVVRLTNLPPTCTVTIYSLDGNVIRTFTRDEAAKDLGTGRLQISPYLEWDLKTNKNILISSGVYLIHVNAPGVGERTIKWFGIMRALDSQRL